MRETQGALFKILIESPVQKLKTRKICYKVVHRATFPITKCSAAFRVPGAPLTLQITDQHCSRHTVLLALRNGPSSGSRGNMWWFSMMSSNYQQLARPPLYQVSHPFNPYYGALPPSKMIVNELKLAKKLKSFNCCSQTASSLVGDIKCMCLNRHINIS